MIAKLYFQDVALYYYLKRFKFHLHIVTAYQVLEPAVNFLFRSLSERSAAVNFRSWIGVGVSLENVGLEP